MKKIGIGATNPEKYHHQDQIIIYKHSNNFNHRFNYQILKQFSFVPKLIKETKEKLIWEFIEGKMLENPSEKDLVIIASHLATLHQSNLDLPSNTLSKRVKHYWEVINQKNEQLAIIEKNLPLIEKYLQSMIFTSPCHNDLSSENIIKDQKGKIWIIDWEYASVGDYHFDLAYFIHDLALNEKQKAIFLNAYCQYRNLKIDKQMIEKMKNYHFLTIWLTLVWAKAQPKLPFDVTYLINDLTNNSF